MGMGEVLVSRMHASGNITYALFLIDFYCLGVKDSFYRFNETPFDYEDFKSDLFYSGDFNNFFFSTVIMPSIRLITMLH